MDMNGIVSLISNVGFPIAMTIALMWYVYVSNKEHLDQVNDINDKHAEQINSINLMHREETKELREVLQKNSDAIEKLSDRLEYISNI